MSRGFGNLRSPITGAPLEEGKHDLHTENERWPVVDGIAFLRADRRTLADEALAALDAGDEETACVILLADQDDWASSSPPNEAARRSVIRASQTLTFREAMQRLELGPVSDYFAHRWSDPTFLSGLALAEAHWHSPASIVELACGAGHFLRAFADREPEAEITGGDLVFAKLWLARHFVAPTARLICFNASRRWPLPDASVDLVFCHDAFYFLSDKHVVASEMKRVAGGGRILVGHAHNAAIENFSRGAPLTPEAYQALFNASLTYDDEELTTALIQARAPRPASVDHLRNVSAIALAAGAASHDIPGALTGGLAIPKDGRKLRRNPLYQLSGAGGHSRCFPSPRYEAEYAALVTYGPTTNAPECAIAGDLAQSQAIRHRELLDLPDRW
jgi:SAM-dependent methyltransferase